MNNNYIETLCDLIILFSDDNYFNYKLLFKAFWTRRFSKEGFNLELLCRVNIHEVSGSEISQL